MLMATARVPFWTIIVGFIAAVIAKIISGRKTKVV
jgi:hypothetical protein